MSFPIRWDFRPVLDALEAMSDPELTGEEKAIATLQIMYPGWEDIPPGDYQEALDRACWFIDGGDIPPQMGHSPRLMDWGQDFPRIIGPVNRVLGREVREEAPTHWWTFLGAFQEIGDCLFAQIVNIRQKRARGKALDKAEREFYRRNQSLIDWQKNYTEAEENLLALWTGGQ